MDIRRVYLKFTDRVNMLSSNHGQHIGGLRQFVDCFNEAELSLLTEAIQADEATDDIQELLQVYVRTVDLKGIKKPRYTAFTLPEDYEHFKNIWVEGTNGSCSALMEVQLRRLGEVSKLYQDGMYAPSLVWEETFAALANNTIRVYTKDFSVTAELDYYKKPKLVDIEGYTIDGVASTNIDPELEGRHLERCLDRAARIHLRNTSNPKVNAY